ncbi:anti-sigma factor RsbA family regulatory protein [Streptomyces sp. NPDC002870]|uniref:anti-sigma factor RsbA family regulatory protein n=1 Tax=Streptomyces sp. NPDC002870 TaxID=3364666 RepID=UPI003685B10A
MSTDPSHNGFVHQACLYSDEEEFLATAVPFAEEGLTAGEPVLAVTTSANIQLLREALGELALALDTADTAHFGRRPVSRVAGFLRYSNRYGAPGRPVRMIAEPVWAGKCARQITEGKRMESGLNVLLAHTDARLICAYDTRTVPDHVVEAAWATHPRHVVGDLVLPCGTYTDPEVYAPAGQDPLPPPPAGAALLEPPASLAAVRSFARLRARAAGLAGERVALAETLANEALTWLLAHGSADAELRVWEEPGAVVWDLLALNREAALPGPYAGFVPPGPEAGQHDGLWLLRSLCEAVELRGEDGGGLRLRLHCAGPRTLQSPWH